MFFLNLLSLYFLLYTVHLEFNFFLLNFTQILHLNPKH